jgi:predicted secreted hydrolase
VEPRRFAFPEDHGPHSDFRTEWWYFTGNLDDAQGRRFGFQLTFFRNALAPSMPPRESPWAARQVQMAHFALTDAGAGVFHHAERFAREAAGLAGARAEPFEVWLLDWSARGSSPAAPFPVHLRAATDAGDAAIDLVLEQGRPPVLQGDAGLSRKGPEPGNASYYYSLTRMPARGTVRAGGRTYAVLGAAWMDREWSTSALGPGLAGWDWFALQLDDGRDVMFYRLRRDDGTTDPFSKGSIVGPRGDVSVVAAAGVVLEEDGSRWRSPHSGAAYPSRWRLRVPAHGIDVVVAPVLADQEFGGIVVYWEGAVNVSGSATGRGYVEMTGYDEPRAARPR